MRNERVCLLNATATDVDVLTTALSKAKQSREKDLAARQAIVIAGVIDVAQKQLRHSH